MDNCRSKGAAPGYKVAILGAAGGIGQPLSLLLKTNPLVSVLHLYDVFNTPGVTADLSHLNTSPVVSYKFWHASPLHPLHCGSSVSVLRLHLFLVPALRRERGRE